MLRGPTRAHPDSGAARIAHKVPNLGGATSVGVILRGSVSVFSIKPRPAWRRRYCFGGARLWILAVLAAPMGASAQLVPTGDPPPPPYQAPYVPATDAAVLQQVPS